MKTSSFSAPFSAPFNAPFSALGSSLLDVRRQLSVGSGFRGLMSPLCVVALSLSACADEPNFERLLVGGSPVVARAGEMAGTNISAGTMGTAGAMNTAGESVGATEAGVMGATEIGGEAGVVGATEAGDEAGDEGGSTPPLTNLMQGRWESRGADLSSILSDPSVGITSLKADFKEDMSFVVEVSNSDGFTFELLGTYSLTPAPNRALTDEGVIHEITLNQSYPEPATSLGIWQVEGALLTYEVVQTDPPLPGGQTPPTRAAGFGSTNSGALGDANVQRYRRLP